jgi:hypothetical protein
LLQEIVEDADSNLEIVSEIGDSILISASPSTLSLMIATHTPTMVNLPWSN